MIAATRVPCPDCGHWNAARATVCGACGGLQCTVPRAEGAIVHLAPPPRASGARLPLLAGAALAPALAFAPLLRYVGWFLGALCHETGHALAAWAAGCPALPVISLEGHAMATHGAQSAPLCVVLWVGLAALAWRCRREPAGVLVLGPLALLYPLFAFTGAREAVFVLGGHLGELAFGGVFLWRALKGGFSASPAERVANAALGWFLVGRNLWLAGGLLASADVRAWYGGSGSFGLTNDYLRLAREVWRVDLGVVASLMLLATLATPALVWLLSRGRR